MYCRTIHSHGSSYTYTPTVRRYWTPETCEFKSPSRLLLFLHYSSPVYCRATVHTWWVGGLLVGGWCYCSTAVLLLHCPAVTLASRRSLARSIAPSIAASIASRHRRPGVLGPPWSIARRRPLARSPAVVRSFARRRSPASALVHINP